MVTPAAGRALQWLHQEYVRDHALRLPGRKVVVLGAAAEMASTRHWLQAGADVLWLDLAPPPDDLLAASALSGTLHWPVQGADLLRQPREVLATILAFADGEAVDLALYAYAPGQARELRLTAVMNAITDSLPADLIASVSLLISPTTPTALSPEDQALMDARSARRPAWEAALAACGLLGRGGGRAETAAAAATRTIVSMQGASYQAAQYLGKIAAAHAWSKFGPASANRVTPIRVSANTAAITRTRSMDHPVFAAAFAGATAFGVETLVPRQSRCLNGLLAIHDWLHPEPPVPGVIRVHGGIHSLPYPMEQALRVAACFGFMRSPRLLRGLLRG